MPELVIDSKKIDEGRAAVDAYRVAHTQLYSKGWYKGIPEAHTPLLEKMLADLKIAGFNSLDEFFAASALFNVNELGFASKEDFNARAKDADREALDRMWQ